MINWLTRRDQAEKPRALREIHSLTGDAALLGLTEVASLGGSCENEVKLLHAGSTEADIEHLVAALRELERLIEGLGGAPRS